MACRSRVDAIQAAIAAELEAQRPGLDRLAEVSSVYLIAYLHPRTGRVLRVNCRPETSRELPKPSDLC